MGLLVASTEASSDYPDETNTGVPSGTTLTPTSGLVSSTEDGDIIEDLEITTGAIRVTHDNVIVRRCRIIGVNFSNAGFVEVINANNILVEDCEMFGDGTSPINCPQNGVDVTGTGSITIQRCNMEGFENGIQATSNVTFTDNYLHDFVTYDPGPDPHSDGVQIFSGSEVIIRHNTIYASKGGASDPAGEVSNSSITLAVHTNYLIEDNLLAGGGYNIDLANGGQTNLQCINNRFSRLFHPNVGLFGVINGGNNFNTFTGNVYHETGLPVDPDD